MRKRLILFLLLAPYVFSTFPAIAQQPAEVATLQWLGLGVHALAFSSDGKILAVSGQAYSDKCNVQLWDVATRQEKKRLAALSGFSSSIAFSPDNRSLAAASSLAPDSIHIWEVATGQLRTKMNKYSKDDSLASKTVGFSPDGKLFVSGELGGTVIVWNAGTMKIQVSFTAHKKRLNDLAFSRDGKLLATASEDKSVIIWDAVTFKQKSVLLRHKDEVKCIAWSNGGSLLASGSEDGTVIIWNVGSGEALATLKNEGATWVDSVAFSGNDELLASGGTDHFVRLWNVKTGNLDATLKGHTDRIRCVRFSPGGTFLASGSQDGTVKLWEIARK